MANLERVPLIENNDMTREERKLPLSQLHPYFRNLVYMAVEAIGKDIYPQLIYSGSSGSYFVFNTEKKIIGVFKPKNEEPYGKLNPKWLKWLHRICLPCCFGRSCLIPNKGYLSEAGAYIVDSKLGLGIVPPTFVTCLSCKNFNYSHLDRSNRKAKVFLKKNFYHVMHGLDSGLPPKIGSFQQFAEGYKNAYTYLSEFEKNPLSPEVDKKMKYLFEKMVILDYIIRNTDRGDNWLIKVEEKKESILSQDDASNHSDKQIYLAAIDNGLAFPFKHPDSWRTYPYSWSTLSYAHKPFSAEIKELILPKISNASFIQNLVDDLHLLFSIDKGFDKERFEEQMSLMKAQIQNLCTALRTNEFTPENLTHLEVYYVVPCSKESTSAQKLLDLLPSKIPF